MARLTRGQLRWNYTAVHPGIYIPNGVERTVFHNTVAAWLWTGRKGVIAGRAAAALHGAEWVDESTPIEVITEHTRRRAGVIVHEKGSPTTRSPRSAIYRSRRLHGPRWTSPVACRATPRWHIWTHWPPRPVSRMPMPSRWPTSIAVRGAFDAPGRLWL